MDDTALPLLRKLVAEQAWSYRTAGPQATEPAAFACLALCGQGFATEALPIAAWLDEVQTDVGSVGVTADQSKPAWPTSLAVLAWLEIEQTGLADYQQQQRRAVEWILQTEGKRLPRRRQIGHDTTITGWSWAENTHSWLEPTCLFVLALRAVGNSNHQRTRDGIAMIIDRLHESGGCNYGNTVVLGQSTLPHVQPTGLAMLAIANSSVNDLRIDRSLEYLERSLAHDTATTSLCFAILGLTAHQRRPANASALLTHALKRDSEHGNLSCYKLALITLAEMEDLSWLPLSQPQFKPLAQMN